MINSYEHFIPNLQKNFSISENESQALSSYIYSKGKEINRCIWKTHLTPEISWLILNLEQAIKLLPRVSKIKCYRNFDFIGIEVNKALDFFELNLGKQILFSSFLSTTQIENFTGNDLDYELTIEIETVDNSNAIDIASIKKACNIHDTEKEILFNRNTCFTVKCVNRQSKIKVQLTEFNKIGCIPFPTF